jgi:ribonuclease BN (tRNA processing enzyme)
MASVTILGGAAAGGNAGQGCSGILVRTETLAFVLDFGPGVMPELKKQIDFRTLDAIVISHLHLDHTLDLGALRFALAYSPTPASRRVPLWMPPGGIDFLKRFGSAFDDPGEPSDFFDHTFAIAEYEPTRAVAIGDVRIRFHRTVHGIPCWAMRVSIPGVEDFFFTGDGGPTSNLAIPARGCKVIACESGTWDGEMGHMKPDQAGQLASDAGASTLILTHLWEEFGFENYRRAAASTFSGELLIAKPGLTVEL